MSWAPLAYCGLTFGVAWLSFNYVEKPFLALRSLPTDLGDAPVPWESYEGMWATFGQTLTVTEQFTHGQFGEVVVSPG